MSLTFNFSFFASLLEGETSAGLTKPVCTMDGKEAVGDEAHNQGPWWDQISSGSHCATCCQMILSWWWLARFPWPQHHCHITPFSTTWRWSLFQGALCFDFYSCLLSTVLSLSHIVQSGMPLFPLSQHWIFFLVVPTMTGLQRRDEFFSLKLSTSEKRPDSAWVTEIACLADIKLTGRPVPTAMFPALTPFSFWTPQSTHPHQTWTFLWACNQNQAACNRGELFGLQTCCWGQRPCRVWIPLCGKGPAAWTGIKGPCRIKRWEKKDGVEGVLSQIYVVNRVTERVHSSL